MNQNTARIETVIFLWNKAIIKVYLGLGLYMSADAVCDYLGCGNTGDIVSRLSPEGFLVATGKKAYSFREAYRILKPGGTYYCLEFSKPNSFFVSNIYSF